MSKFVEIKDPYTYGHQQRVGALSRRIAQNMGLPEDQIEAIEIASLLHDIGKVMLPSEIMTKPGKLTEQEFGLIKGHAENGYEILKEIDFGRPIAEIVRQHHERLDGSGYPNGIKNDEILLEARIMAVADVVEAMMSFRPYRPALGLEAALDEIKKNSGRLYDKEVVNHCIRILESGFMFQDDSSG